METRIMPTPASASEIGNARARLASIMRGEEIGIDNLALSRMVDMIIENTPKVSLAGPDSNICFTDGPEYHISLKLQEVVEKYDFMDSLTIKYNIVTNVPKSGNNETDVDAILAALQKVIKVRQKKNRAAITRWLPSLPE